jgi:hypothetical protein
MNGIVTMRTARRAAALALCVAALGAAGASADGIRVSTMGNCSIALVDRDNQLNPYDFGRNPAYLVYDFEESYIRFALSLSESQGDLKRPYDPHLLNDGSGAFSGRKRLGDRHATAGSFRYERIWQREQHRSLELDQYNDPFFLTDLTSGDITHWGPVMTADYSLRLSDRVSVGLGFDYEISTGLKDYYTRPEIVHNYTRGNVGLIVSPREAWRLGFIVRPMRLQNRTKFEKTDEGFDNIIYRYSGDGIYEIRSFSSYSLREVSHGTELGVQNFVSGGPVTVGAQVSYIFADNSIRYNVTTPEEVGYWEEEAYDVKLLARYVPRGLPLVVGVSARSFDQNGWAKRPRFEDVLLYENPLRLRSIGAGASYAYEPLHLVVSAEYVLNSWDITAEDYGAHSFRNRTFTQNVGRLGVEYDAYQVFAVRGGVEITDYLADRWLKLPANTDRYRFTAGASYQWHWWQVEAEVLYARNVTDDAGYEDLQRRDLGGILWFTRLER